MKKAIIAATAAALIAGTAATLAANPPGGDRGRRWQPSAEDFAALTDARIAGIKAALKLTPDQEKLWPAVETTLRDVAKERDARRDAARAARADRDGPPDPIVRLRSAADRMTANAADLRKIADAADPLYKSLSEGQKQRLSFVMRREMRGFGPGGHGFGPGFGPGGHHGPGFGPGGPGFGPGGPGDGDTPDKG